MNIDFVKTPFTNNPTMNRYDGPVFNKKPDSSYLIEKQKEIDTYGESLLGETEISKKENLIEKFKKAEELFAKKKFDHFPNPHIRTTGFLIKGKLFLEFILTQFFICMENIKQ